MNNNDILSVLCGQNSETVNVFDPEILAFRNKVIEIQKNCPMVEWEQDVGATVPLITCQMSKAATMCFAWTPLPC